MAIAAGTILAGNYRVLRPIGAGGMGEVYEAEQLSLGRRVALKVLLDDEEKSLTRFDHEARAMAKLAHPNVVSIIDFHREAERPLLVMELLAGESLHHALAREGTLAPARAIRLALQMLDGLAAAHRAGIIHRDIKPSNVFLTRDARGVEMVKLLDFGLAKADGGPKTTAGVVVGTASYLAPEQILGEPIDARVDLRAVGLCLYEMIAGRKPWRSSGRYELASEIVSSDPPSLAATRAPNDPALASIAPLIAFVDRAIAREKNARFPDATSMTAALEALSPTASSQPMPIATMALAAREPTQPTDIVGPPSPPAFHAMHAVTGVHPSRVAATVSMPAMTATPKEAAPTPPAPFPTRVLVALGVVVFLATGAAIAWQSTREGADASEPSTIPSSSKGAPVATYTTVSQMIKAHAYGETVDGAGCTCYPLDVMKNASLAPLDCANCKEQRVRGSGRCVGDDSTGKRLPGVYLCRQILGPKP